MSEEACCGGVESLPRKFHLSLNVADLEQSVGFYRLLLGVTPAKLHGDYAKFELADPPLVLSLEPQRPIPGGSLNHLGLRVPDADTLVGIQRRLEEAGVSTRREEGVECCYALQTKFWVKDPDRNYWEIYTLDDDLEHRGTGKAPSALGGESAVEEPTLPVVWEHRLGDPFPERIPLEAGTADEVLLRGTFNAAVEREALLALAREARRVLRIGGCVRAHALISDRTLTTAPELPGPAAAVEWVHTLNEPLSVLREAGFVGIHLEKLGASGCFSHEGSTLRELLVTGTKSAVSSFDLPQVVVYQGPFRQLEDDLGHTYPRGVAVSVPNAVAELLRRSPAAAQFTFIAPGGTVPLGGAEGTVGENGTCCPLPAPRA